MLKKTRNLKENLADLAIGLVLEWGWGPERGHRESARARRLKISAKDAGSRWRRPGQGHAGGFKAETDME